jgi:hypothetical protein
MSRIQTISVKNFKAITDLSVDFKGCSAIVTGRNNSGKTSFLRGLVDRIRLSRPDQKVKQGEREGSGELILDTGEKFVWLFDDEGKDKLTYISQEGAKSLVTKDLGAQFFPPLFDIDKFLQSPPKSQVAQLQKIVGLDFTEIDKRFDEAYALRTARNQEAERYHAKISKAIKCEPAKPVDMAKLHLHRADLTDKRRVKADELNGLFKKNQKINQDLRDEFEKAKKVVDLACQERASERTTFNNKMIELETALQTLGRYGYKGSEVIDFIDESWKGMPEDKIATDYYPQEPAYITEMPERDDLDSIDKEIEEVNKQIEEAIENNAAAKRYEEYIELCREVDAAESAAIDADLLVKSIEQERKEMIEKVSFPEGISIDSSIGITVDGFALDRQVLSTSKLYTAALRIASMNLGEVRCLYFDCSFLDNISLSEVNDWAEANDLQLLLERPDYSGGEIKYELIEG